MSLEKELKRSRRKARIRSKIRGTAVCPRLAVFRSNTGIYAQLIDDDKGVVLAQSSSLKSSVKGTKVEIAKAVGADIAKKASSAKVKNCVFDRGGFLYHGRVKALAEGAREGGLQF